MEIEWCGGGASREVSKSEEWQDCYFEDVASGKAAMVLGRRRRAASTLVEVAHTLTQEPGARQEHAVYAS